MTNPTQPPTLRFLKTILFLSGMFIGMWLVIITNNLMGD